MHYRPVYRLRIKVNDMAYNSNQSLKAVTFNLLTINFSDRLNFV